MLREIARLEVPSLLLCGEEDIRPTWPLEQLARQPPDAEFVRVADAAHCNWLTHPDEVGAAIRALLLRVSAQGR